MKKRSVVLRVASPVFAQRHEIIGTEPPWASTAREISSQCPRGTADETAAANVIARLWSERVGGDDNRPHLRYFPALLDRTMHAGAEVEILAIVDWAGKQRCIVRDSLGRVAETVPDRLNCVCGQAFDPRATSCACGRKD